MRSDLTLSRKGNSGSEREVKYSRAHGSLTVSLDQNPDENTSSDPFEKCFKLGFPGFCLKDSEVISWLEGWQWWGWGEA